MNITQLSEYIVDRRKSLGVSQKELAEISGVGLHTLSNLESGKCNSTLEVVMKITDVLGLEMRLAPKVMELTSS